MILHICSKDSWNNAKDAGAYEGDTLSAEGFIHCSTPEQVTEVADYLFKGRKDLILLIIDDENVNKEIKYEDAGNGKFYPHIYGSLNVDAVVKAVDFLPKNDGTFELPNLK